MITECFFFSKDCFLKFFLFFIGRVLLIFEANMVQVKYWKYILTNTFTALVCRWDVGEERNCKIPSYLASVTVCPLFLVFLTKMSYRFNQSLWRHSIQLYLFLEVCFLKSITLLHFLKTVITSKLGRFKSQKRKSYEWAGWRKQKKKAATRVAVFNFLSLFKVVGIKLNIYTVLYTVHFLSLK